MAVCAQILPFPTADRGGWVRGSAPHHSHFQMIQHHGLEGSERDWGGLGMTSISCVDDGCVLSL